MKQSKGFEDHKVKDMVYLLKRSMYGNKRFNTFVTQQGFCRSCYNTYLYFRGEDNLTTEYLLIHVDDMFLSSKDERIVDG